MLNQFSRTELLLGKEGVEKLSKSRVAVFGIGGVGAYAVEALVRSGLGTIDIIDDDKVCITNLNRQLYATHKTVDKYKVDVAKERILDINPNCIVNTYKTFYTPQTENEFDFSQYDYVIDACDSVSTKMLLINECTNKGIKIISSMGTAKKMDATKLKITTLDKTSYDKLAKKLRGMIDKKIQKQTTVISSTEEVKNIEVLGSNSYVPAVAGLLITNYIINDVVNKTN